MRQSHKLHTTAAWVLLSGLRWVKMDGEELRHQVILVESLGTDRIVRNGPPRQLAQLRDDVVFLAPDGAQVQHSAGVATDDGVGNTDRVAHPLSEQNIRQRHQAGR